MKKYISAINELKEETSALTASSTIFVPCIPSPAGVILRRKISHGKKQDKVYM